MRLEGEEEQAYTDMITQRKRQDAWQVNWNKQCVLILEFTLPNDRCQLSLHDTDVFQTARFKPLLDLLAQHRPGWDIQTYTVFIRGSHDQDRWYAQLLRL